MQSVWKIMGTMAIEISDEKYVLTNVVICLVIFIYVCLFEDCD